MHSTAVQVYVSVESPPRPAQVAVRTAVLATSACLATVFLLAQVEPCSLHTLRCGPVPERLWHCFDWWSFHVHSCLLDLTTCQCTTGPALGEKFCGTDSAAQRSWKQKTEAENKGRNRSQSPDKNNNISFRRHTSHTPKHRH